jgi:hypothetical protein
MSNDPNFITPNTHPGADATQVQPAPVVPLASRSFSGEWTESKLIRMALKEWIRDTVVCIPLALFPLMVLGLISWVPAVDHSAELRAVPLVALVLYLPWIGWSLLLAASGRPPIDPFLRHRPHRDFFEPEPYLGRRIVRLLVALVCVPSLIVLALKAPLPGWLMGALTILPVLAYVISVGLAGYVQGVSVICYTMLPPLPNRFPSSDESEPNRP